MLKHGGLAKADVDFYPAAFRRLCVETYLKKYNNMIYNPAAFRRLCVETHDSILFFSHCTPSRL